MTKKVFVSGCFDLLHSGHVRFLEEASQYGDLYVALGSDATVFKLKGRSPVTDQNERLYMMQAIRFVKHAFISQGSGLLDFEQELRDIKPETFVVNSDGNIPLKQQLCKELGIEYIVLERTPHAQLTPRSTTLLRKIDQMPYRIDLAGGWLDQPFVSALYPGPVLTISLEPTLSFNERSGMATSTRNRAIELWGYRLPLETPEKTAKILFSYDNAPGTRTISGSQDAIGIVYPGLAKAQYTGEYWPSHIEHIQDETTLQFIENSIYLLPLDIRPPDYDPLAEQHVNPENAQALAVAAEDCWTAIHRRDIGAFGKAIRASFEAQIALFPKMVDATIQNVINAQSEQAFGWKLTGAGGGGYLLLVADHPIENTFRVNIRRELG